MQGRTMKKKKHFFLLFYFPSSFLQLIQLELFNLQDAFKLHSIVKDALNYFIFFYAKGSLFQHVSTSFNIYFSRFMLKHKKNKKMQLSFYTVLLVSFTCSIFLMFVFILYFTQQVLIIKRLLMHSLFWSPVASRFELHRQMQFSVPTWLIILRMF